MSDRKAILSVGAVFLLLLAGRVIYYNIVVPWPYRHELRACLEEARSLESVDEIEVAENICFRTYPHFN